MSFRGYAKCGCEKWDEGVFHDEDCANNPRRREPSAIDAAKAILRCSAREAEAWLQAEAQRRGLTVEAVARRVVAGDIRPTGTPPLF